MPTQHDIARHLGISVASVSMALTGKGRIAPATRARIQATAERLGYRMDASARATRTGRTDLIGLLAIVPSWKGRLYPQVLDGIIEVLQVDGLSPAVAHVDEEHLLQLADQPPLLNQRRCDGFLVNYHMPPTRDLWQAVARAQRPAVWIHSRLDANCVFIDERASMRLAVQALVEAGHRRIALADYHHPPGLEQQAHHSVVDRRAALADVCREAGVEARLLVPPQRLGDAEALAFTIAAVGAADAPTAIIAYGPREATLVQIAAAVCGRRLRDDLALIQCAERADATGTLVDTILLPLAEVGRQAARMLLERLGDDLPHLPVAIPATLVSGHTTTCR
jgi:LacI family transcriptional regulator